MFNECSQLSYRHIAVALTRLAEKNSLVKKAYFDENPPTKLHWSYWLFFKFVNPDDNEPTNPIDYASMLMNPSDNIENIDAEYITQVLDKLPEKERNRFRDGVFAESDEGRAYYAFNRELHIKEFEIPKEGSTDVGMDFNVNPMTAAAGKQINGVFHLFNDVFLSNSDTYKMSDHLLKAGLKGANVIPDSTGANRKTSGKSDHIILKEAGFTVVPTRNPMQVDRVNNVNRLLTQGKLIIHPRCKKLITDLEMVSWRNGELNKKDDPMLTHISDSLGYLLWKRDPIKMDMSGYKIGAQ